MAKNRRGSSTRKHKIKQPVPKPVKVKVPAKKTTDKSTKPEVLLQKCEDKLRGGVDAKGKPLTDEEITKIKTRIGNLEHWLGITHET